MNRLGAVETFVVATPLARPVRSFVRGAEETHTLVVRVRTNGGDGVGFVSAFSSSIALALVDLVAELAKGLAGADAGDLRDADLRMRQSLRLIGVSGPSASAMAAIDLALWDLKGQVLGRPVHSLLGSRQSRLETYASDGCWLVHPDRVVQEALAAVDAGFTAVKVRVGRQNPRVDLETLHRVR